MDGIHDLGGKQGFGPIDVDEPVEPFHAEWEARIWGVTCSTGAPGITIDWWRHVRETTDPADYLMRPYLDSWSQTDMATLVDAGVCTVAELATGKSSTAPLENATPIGVEEVLKINRGNATRFDRPSKTSPQYEVGNAISAQSFTSTGHTRLPAYVRGRPRQIHVHHGAHLLPDAGAKGAEVAEHLYTVAFEACDLWPEARNSIDVIYLDLWESYLEPR